VGAGGAEAVRGERAMSDRVTIGDNALEPYEWDGKRVVTFEQIAQVHGVPVKTVTRSHDRHRSRFQEVKHVYRLDFAQSQMLLKGGANPNGLTVFTEYGYFLLVKPMRDDLAWQIYDVMIETYFRVQQAQQNVHQESEVDKLAKVVGYVDAKKVDKLQHEQDLNALQQHVNSQLEAERKQTNNKLNTIDDKVSDIKDEVDRIATTAAGPHPIIETSDRLKPEDWPTTVWAFILNKKVFLGFKYKKVPMDYKDVFKAYMRETYRELDKGEPEADNPHLFINERYRQCDVVEAYYQAMGGDERFKEVLQGQPNISKSAPKSPLKSVPKSPLQYEARETRNT
jgi:hypothetical protein